MLSNQKFDSAYDLADIHFQGRKDGRGTSLLICSRIFAAFDKTFDFDQMDNLHNLFLRLSIPDHSIRLHAGPISVHCQQQTSLPWCLQGKGCSMEGRGKRGVWGEGACVVVTKWAGNLGVWDSGKGVGARGLGVRGEEGAEKRGSRTCSQIQWRWRGHALDIEDLVLR